MRTKIVLLAATFVALKGLTASAAIGPPGEWQHWQAEVEINNLASRQRGARNFVAYCSGCHSVKYLRYSRLGTDLGIPTEQLEQFLLPPGAKASDYMATPMPKADAEAWFGTAPPDLSLITRSKGADYVYRFLKTFYVDPDKPSGVNNLALDSTAMPHVLSSLQGLQTAVLRNEEQPSEGGKPVTVRAWEKFQLDVPGTLTPAEYDKFVGDLVNFLQYAGEPVQVKRQALGIWVVLFLLVFTVLAYFLKREYWRDVR